MRRCAAAGPGPRPARSSPRHDERIRDRGGTGTIVSFQALEPDIRRVRRDFDPCARRGKIARPCIPDGTASDLRDAYEARPQRETHACASWFSEILNEPAEDEMVRGLSAGAVLAADRNHRVIVHRRREEGVEETLDVERAVVEPGLV